MAAVSATSSSGSESATGRPAQARAPSARRRSRRSGSRPSSRRPRRHRPTPRPRRRSHVGPRSGDEPSGLVGGGPQMAGVGWRARDRAPSCGSEIRPRMGARCHISRVEVRRVFGTRSSQSGSSAAAIESTTNACSNASCRTRAGPGRCLVGDRVTRCRPGQGWHSTMSPAAYEQLGADPPEPARCTGVARGGEVDEESVGGGLSR